MACIFVHLEADFPGHVGIPGIIISWARQMIGKVLSELKLIQFCSKHTVWNYAEIFSERTENALTFPGKELSHNCNRND